MYHLRFDFAVLSLFTYEQLATSFTVTEPAPGTFCVFTGKECLGVVRKDPASIGYYADKVEFFPAPAACRCTTGPQWSGSPNPANPDTEWLCDDCGRVIKATL